MTFILPLRGTLIRKVVGTPVGYTISDVEPNGFFCNLVLPDQDLIPTEGPPRASQAMKLRFPAGTLSPLHPPTSAGDRVQVGDDTWECLARPRTVKTGRRVIGAECAVMRVSELYPLEALLSDGQTTVRSDVVLAMWSPNDSHGNSGAYESFEAEAPLDFVDDLKPNRMLVMSGVRFHIARAFVQVNVPRVSMQIRRRDNG